MLDALSGLLDGGAIDLMSHGGDVLAVLKLSETGDKQAVSGELTFNTIAREDAASAQGSAKSAHPRSGWP